jgi:glycosyltransferase involved in cell wall biosynthesis
LNAQGDYETVIQRELSSLSKGQYRCIPFEPDVAAAYQSMDLFVHVPVDNHSEAFGQIYVEALASGIPAVYTRSGIANDKRFDEASRLVAYKDSQAIYEAMLAVLTDKEGTKAKIAAGRMLAQEFDLPQFIRKLERLYTDQL